MKRVSLNKIPESAIYWGKRLGQSTSSFTELSGGINNHIICFDKTWILKSYKHRNREKHDRMLAEVQFLEYSNAVAPSFTPRLLAVDELRRCVVLEYIDGNTLEESSSPSSKQTQAALEFFFNLNNKPQLARSMIQTNAAEGFHSLIQHMNNVRARSVNMHVEHIPHQYQKKAKEILSSLRSQIEIESSSLQGNLSLQRVMDVISLDRLVVSPGDFGFHNAICGEDKTTFIDFEFSGWDDPAKTILDFSLQPKVPIRENPFILLDALPTKVRRTVASRIISMLPILRLKWICIMLNILNVQRHCEIMSSISIGEQAMFYERRLNSAENYLKSNLQQDLLLNLSHLI